MNRTYLHLGVDDFADSLAQYSTVFGMPPTMTDGDCAKWRLDDQSAVFAISAGDASRGIEFMGAEVDCIDDIIALAVLLDRDGSAYDNDDRDTVRGSVTDLRAEGGSASAVG